MKHTWPALLVLTALLLGACTAPPDQSIIVTTARAPGEKCDFSDPTKYVEGGSIDLAAFGGASSYYQIFGWGNDLQNIGVTVNGQQITTETPNTFVATGIKLSYVVVGGAIPTPPPGVVNISATIAPGATPTTNSVGVFLLTQQAAQAICGSKDYTCPLFPPGKATVTLQVTFQITGALVGGGAAQTNPITYPLTLSNYGNVTISGTSPPVCTSPYVPQTTSCGVPGRDIPFCVL